jgi:hypothetical protein
MIALSKTKAIAVLRFDQEGSHFHKPKSHFQQSKRSHSPKMIAILKFNQQDDRDCNDEKKAITLILSN